MKKSLAFSRQLSARSLVCLSLLVLLILAACVPATEPDVLNKTPGPSFTVTDQVYENGKFSVRYPEGWRVQSGEASQPLSVIFVAPDEISIIQIQVGTLDSANFSDPKKKTDVRGLTLSDGVEITAILSAVKDNFDTLQPIFEQMLTTIKAA